MYIMKVHQKIYGLFHFTVLIFALILLHSCTSNSGKNVKPNIILIVTDDQGWGDLAINGNTKIHTPNIDNLATQGIQFSRFYVSPVCSPTRAEILTGRYHPRGGVYSTSQGGERLDLDEMTIGDVFKSNGYHTSAYGKWHNGTQAPYHPNSRGFDEFYGFCSGHWANYFDPMLEKNGEVVKGNGFIIDDLTEHAMDFISSKTDNPFFTLLAYNTPHSPMQVPDHWWHKYKDVSLDSTHRYADREKQDKTRAALALCENIDWNVGRLIDHLDQLDILENTIIIYMSDNGPNGWRWNDGLKGIKGHTDEGGVRSPFIMYWKNEFKSHKIDQLASTIDILPTLADVANISIPEHKPIDGISLKPLLVQEVNNWKDRNIFSHWNGAVSVRNQQYLLDQNDHMFDLIEDPGQLNKLVQPPEPEFTTLMNAKKEWIITVLAELDRDRKEVLPIGWGGSRFTHLPARDGTAHGTIIRSNRWPNSSYFTHWTSDADRITWDSEILTSGNYKATVYYTCKSSALGSTLLLQQGNNQLRTTINKTHDPPFLGVEFDRFARQESFEKDFLALDMGMIKMDKGSHTVSLSSENMQGPEFIDFRLLVLEKN